MVIKLLLAVQLTLLLIGHCYGKDEKNIPMAAPGCAACPHPYVRNPFSSTCTRLVREPLSWFDAEKYCMENGGERLVFLKTLHAASWFVNQRQTNYAWRGGDVWLGGRRYLGNGTWYWTRKPTQDLKYAMWAVGQPDTEMDSCLESSDSNGINSYKFADASCNQTKFFMCEKKLRHFYQEKLMFHPQMKP